ncbi:flagellar basal-body MS-ring/collar protein FliF [Marinicellulosiphila megalodicopiae]|uniref:flagellar basal-body MS-ring/collar protein FliF n=1 Tax=Marinicellulosiphila megalodicopiae TaxID=2724896 RepID=UPI003BAE950D
MNSQNVKLFSVFAGVILVIAIIVIYMVTSKEGYQNVASNLDDAALARATNTLDHNQINYKIDPETQTIKVAKSDAQKVSGLLFDNGVVEERQKGYELFDESDFGITDFAQQVNYRRALEGEIANTLMAMPEVQKARVHLAIQRQVLFQESTPSSAAITMWTVIDKFLTTNQIAGIKQLVANSVPEISSENVSVFDHNGVELTGRQSSNGNQAQEALEKKVHTILSGYLPEQNIKVIATISYDYSRSEIKEENWLPVNNQQGALLSKTTSQTSEQSGNTTSTTEEKWAFNHQLISRVEELADNISKMDVSIYIDEDLKEQEIDQLNYLVRSAIGLDKQRGDSLFIFAAKSRFTQVKLQEPVYDIETTESTSMENTSDINESHQTANINNTWLSTYWWAGYIILFGFIIILIVRLTKTNQSKNEDVNSDQITALVEKWQNK